MVSIGERLRDERGRLGLTQPALAAVGGVTKKTQVLYEAGERSPDAVYLAAVAAIGVDVLYVLTGQHAGGVKPAPSLSAEEQMLVQYFREATPPVRRAAMGALVGAATPAPSPAPTPAPPPKTFNVGGQVSTHAGSVQVGYAGGGVSVRTGGGKAAKRPK